ncbi:MAG: C25 family cysteine peptidase [Pirellulales bacterium]
MGKQLPQDAARARWRARLRSGRRSARLAAWIAVWLAMASASLAADMVVVCPVAFREALQPWLEHRARQGHTFAFVSNTDPPEAIRQGIRTAAREGSVRFVVLVGDADPRMDSDPALRARSVPTYLAQAKVNIYWRSEPQLATDNWYADLDDDQIPELAIGRLTADSPEELSRIIAKILAYEQAADFGPWRRRISLVAGVGGFGALADAVLEAGARQFLTEGIPAAYATSVTYGSWRSPYCPDPREFQQTTLQRLNEGCLFWVYIGHGQRRDVDRMYLPTGKYMLGFPILSANDVPRLRCGPAAPIAVFLACYTGAFDGPEDCLAEEMLRAPGGPVAIVAGSRVTMPYAMSVMGIEWMDECFRKQRETLGETLLHAKRNMVLGGRQGKTRQALDAVAAAISPAATKPEAERAEHVLLFNLFGDPALRLRYPREVKIAAPPKIEPGGRLEIAGECSVAGQCTVEFVVRRDALTFKPPARRQDQLTSASLVDFQNVYHQANDPRLGSATVPLVDGKFHAQFDIPPNARGPCHVRVFIQGQDDFAVGAADVEVQPADYNRVGKAEVDRETR